MVTLWLAECALEVVVLWALGLWGLQVVAGSVGAALWMQLQLAECQLEVVVDEHGLVVLWLEVPALLRCRPLVGWRNCCRLQNGSLRVHCTPAHIAIEGKGNVLTHV